MRIWPFKRWKNRELERKLKLNTEYGKQVQLKGVKSFDMDVVSAYPPDYKSVYQRLNDLEPKVSNAEGRLDSHASSLMGLQALYDELRARVIKQDAVVEHLCKHICEDAPNAVEVTDDFMGVDPTIELESYQEWYEWVLSLGYKVCSPEYKKAVEKAGKLLDASLQQRPYSTSNETVFMGVYKKGAEAELVSITVQDFIELLSLPVWLKEYWPNEKRGGSE